MSLWLLQLVPSISFAILCISISIYSAIVMKRVYFHPLTRYPGPKLWAASRMPYVWAMWTGKLAHRIREYHDKYGPAIRVAPNELSFIEPDACRDIFARRADQKSFSKNPIWVPPPSSERPLNILNAHDEEHSRLRRVFSYAFSDQSLREQEPLIVLEVDKMIEKLHSLIKSGISVVDIGKWIDFCIFDITGSLAFGASYGCLDTGTYQESLRLAVFSIKASVLRAVFRYYPWLFNLLMITVGRSTQSKTLKHLSYSQQKVRERLAQPTDRPDILNHLQNASRNLSATEIEINASVLIAASNHTVNSTLIGAITFLLRYPETMRRLIEEVRHAFPSKADITLKGLEKLPYLSAVVEESLRIVSRVPLGTPRVTPSPGATICGEWVPGGTFVAYMQWAASLSKLNFRKANEFIPERWLDPNVFPEAIPFQEDRPDALQPFNLGPRDCVGRHLANFELRLIMAKLLYDFDLSLPGGPESGLIWEGQDTFVLWQRNPVLVRINARS